MTRAEFAELSRAEKVKLLLFLISQLNEENQKIIVTKMREMLAAKESKDGEQV